MKTRQSTGYDFDVAISFAGEDRVVAERIAGSLKEKGIRVFYDKDEQADLWGKDLYEHLADVYANRARFCLVLISCPYAKKLWTKHEIRNALTRALQESQEYILPLKLDDTTLPGIRPTIGYHDFRNSSIEETVDLIFTKLGRASAGKNERQVNDWSGATKRTSKIPLPPIKRQLSDRDREVDPSVKTKFELF